MRGLFRVLSYVVIMAFSGWLVITLRLNTLTIDPGDSGWTSETKAVLKFGRHSNGNDPINLEDPVIGNSEINSTHMVALIIVTYMKAGGSYLGSILNSYNQVFYHMEPGHVFRRPSTDPRLNYECHNPPDYTCEHWANTELMVGLLENIISCKYPDYYLKYLNLMGSFRDQSAAMWQDDVCNIRRLKPSSSNMTVENIKCSFLTNNLVEQLCKAYPVTVLKINRLNDSATFREFLERNPDIKVIHLHRDPREIINSRMRDNIYRDYGHESGRKQPYKRTPITREQMLGLVREDAQSLCQKMTDNRKLNQSPFLSITYTELLTDPEKAFRLLSNYTGLGPVSGLESAIRGDNYYKKYAKLFKRKTDTRRTLNNKLEKEFLQIIDQQCRNVYADHLYPYGATLSQ